MAVRVLFELVSLLQVATAIPVLKDCVFRGNIVGVKQTGLGDLFDQTTSIVDTYDSEMRLVAYEQCYDTDGKHLKSFKLHWQIPSPDGGESSEPILISERVGPESNVNEAICFENKVA